MKIHSFNPVFPALSILLNSSARCCLEQVPYISNM